MSESLSCFLNQSCIFYLTRSDGERPSLNLSLDSKRLRRNNKRPNSLILFFMRETLMIVKTVIENVVLGWVLEKQAHLLKNESCLRPRAKLSK